MPLPDTTPTRVELLARERVANGYCKVDKLTLRHEQYAGGMGPEIVREVVERGNAAAVLLYDPVRECCVMIEQFRPGAWLADQAPWMLEIVAGIIEPGETAEAVCRREAEEEAGVRIGELQKIMSYMVTPGVCTETIDLFVGRVDASEAHGLHGVAAEGEDIRVFTMTVDELQWALETGKVNNVTTIIAIQWLMLNRDRLHQQWGC